MTLRRDVSRRSLQSGFVQLGAQAIQLVLTIASGVLLARLLTPIDFGLLGMAAILVTLGTVIGDFGFATAIVQRDELHPRQLSDLFWFTQRLSIALTVALIALAPVLAWVYAEPRVTSITAAMALVGLVARLGAQHEGLLMREMRFRTLRGIEISALFAGMAVGIAAAWLRAGPWALVLQALTTAAARSSLLWMTSRWRPTWRTSAPVVGDTTAEVSSMLRFGRNLTLARLLRHVSQNFDRAVVGYMSGSHALGLYDNAYRWSIQMIQQVDVPLRSVAVSGLSRLREDAAQYRAAVRKALLPVLAVLVPGLTFLAIESFPILVTVLGPKWAGAAPLFRVLCIAAIANAIGRATVWLYHAEGRTGRQLRWGILSLPVMLIVILIGSRWGPIGVAIGFATGHWLLLVPEIAYCVRHSPVRGADYVAAAARPILASLAAAAVLVVARATLGGEASVSWLATALGIFTACFTVTWLALPGGVRVTRDLLTMLVSAFSIPTRSNG